MENILQNLSFFSRLSQRVGAKIYPQSKPETHLIKSDRFLPPRPGYAEAAALTHERIAVEVERQQLRAMTYRKAYPCVLAVSLLLLLVPLVSVGSSMVENHRHEVALQKRLKAQQEKQKEQDEKLRRQFGIY